MTTTISHRLRMAFVICEVTVSRTLQETRPSEFHLRKRQAASDHHQSAWPTSAVESARHHPVQTGLVNEDSQTHPIILAVNRVGQYPSIMTSQVPLINWVKSASRLFLLSAPTLSLEREALRERSMLCEMLDSSWSTMSQFPNVLQVR